MGDWYFRNTKFLEWKTIQILCLLPGTVPHWKPAKKLLRNVPLKKVNHFENLFWKFLIGLHFTITELHLQKKDQNCILAFKSWSFQVSSPFYQQIALVYNYWYIWKNLFPITVHVRQIINAWIRQTFLRRWRLAYLIRWISNREFFSLPCSESHLLTSPLSCTVRSQKSH